MQTVFTSCRARLAASASTIIGLSLLGACQPRTIAQPQAAPVQPVVNTQPIMTSEPMEQQLYEVNQPEVTNDTFATTLAIGEEDGTGPIPVEPNGGIGDGAGPIPVDYGTPQIGEVEGDYERVFIPDEPVADNRPTTLAIGEEG